MSKINSKQVFLVLMFSLVFSLTSLADTRSERAYSLAVKALSAKLQNDLSTQNVDLKLEHVNRYNISKNEIGLKGDAAANDQQIKFDVKIDMIKAVPTAVSYDFVREQEMAAALDDSAATETLNRSLILKLKQDFKIANIVIALDECGAPVESNGKKIFQGTGDARLGFDWQKIDYMVVLDKNNKPEEVSYKIQ